MVWEQVKPRAKVWAVVVGLTWLLMVFGIFLQSTRHPSGLGEFGSVGLVACAFFSLFACAVYGFGVFLLFLLAHVQRFQSDPEYRAKIEAMPPSDSSFSNDPFN